MENLTQLEFLQQKFLWFLIQIFILLPLFLLFFFILTLVRYKRSVHLSSEVRKKRRFWFLFVCIAGGIAFLIWLTVVILFFALLAEGVPAPI